MKQVIADEIELSSPEPGIEDLSEIFQTKSMRFSFLAPMGGNKFKPFHPSVKCRDYLSDIIHCKSVGSGFKIFGMSMSHKQNLLDTETTWMLVTNPSAKEAEQFISNFEMIQNIEKDMYDIPISELYCVRGSNVKLMIKADSFWQRTTQLISLLTLLCRSCLYLSSPKDDWMKITTGIDGGYIKRMANFDLEKKISLLSKLNFDKSPSPSGFKSTTDTNNVHNLGGILSLITGCRDCLQDKPYNEMLKNEYFNQLQTLAAK